MLLHTFCVVQAVIDIHKKRLTDDQERVEDEAGGINVEAAAKRMRMEDMVDKDLYRQKIKQKHRVSVPTTFIW